MSQRGYKILVVAATPTLAARLVAWLGDSSNELLVTNAYPEAKLHFKANPDLIITEVKLAEYNGLQLALRGQTAGIPTIVLGPGKNGFQHEADQLGVTYLAADNLEPDELTAVIERVLDDPHYDVVTLPGWAALSDTARVLQ